MNKMGEAAPALAFARQQKLHGEELPAVAFLEAVRGEQAASERDLQSFASARPWISPRYTELQRLSTQIVADLLRSDGRGALEALGRYPDVRRVEVLFSRARAHLLVNDYASAEPMFRSALREGHTFSNSAFMRAQVPLFSLLCHFYLGQLYEATGKTPQAIDEYQSFLSHFEGSRTKLPQVVEARAALKRLMH